MLRASNRLLLDAIPAIGIPGDHPMPKGAAAFEARLITDEEGEAVRCTPSNLLRPMIQ